MKLCESVVGQYKNKGGRFLQEINPSKNLTLGSRHYSGERLGVEADQVKTKRE